MTVDRVVFLGGPRQHDAVERGTPFADLLEDQSLARVDLEKIAPSPREPISDVGYFGILTPQSMTPFRTANLRLAVLGKGMEQIRITEVPSPPQMTDTVEAIRPLLVKKGSFRRSERGRQVINALAEVIRNVNNEIGGVA